jgi:hypothetical protein
LRFDVSKSFSRAGSIWNSEVERDFEDPDAAVARVLPRGVARRVVQLVELVDDRLAHNGIGLDLLVTGLEERLEAVGREARHLLGGETSWPDMGSSLFLPGAPRRQDRLIP